MIKKLTPLKAFYDLLNPMGLNSEGLKRYSLIETELKALEESKKENALLKENNHSLEELMKRPELVIVKENIQLHRDNDLLLINERSARQENKKLKEVLEIIKENLVVGCDESKNDKPCLIIGIKVDKDKLVIIYKTFDKEKIDLLKEALL